ncbi:hypothetical protein BCR37DRAFT_385998 [Protomyces lactucae-debilis]|uniref:Uncharacterized protein n=1 Tax=Protomyces lactucae-debilis TaxID=2754530 RepID=A0A1Y2FNT5_PROLT|nr:uncharacterized protein BCR37DRAFT_385998 [Protomyces lactucae-debilis]ORY85589.1 hypothetical protein BCR37DRAFT_385998 [Protomyces lactucae-debilis]
MVWVTSLIKGLAIVTTLATQLVSAQAPGSATIPIKGPRISFTCPDGSPLGVTADNGRNAPVCAAGDSAIFSAAFFLDNNFNHVGDAAQTAAVKAANAFGIVYYLSTVNPVPSTGTYLSTFYEFGGGSDPNGTLPVYLTDYTAGENQRYLTTDQGFLFYLQPDGRYKIQSIQRNNEQLSNGPDTGYWQIDASKRIISPVAGGPNEAALFGITLSPSTADYPADPTENLSLAASPAQQGKFNIGYQGQNLALSGQSYVFGTSTPSQFSFVSSTRTPGMWSIVDQSSGQFVAVSPSSGLEAASTQSVSTDFDVLPLDSGFFGLYSQLNGGKYIVMDPTTMNFAASGDELPALSDNFAVVPAAAPVQSTTAVIPSTTLVSTTSVVESSSTSTDALTTTTTTSLVPETSSLATTSTVDPTTSAITSITPLITSSSTIIPLTSSAEVSSSTVLTATPSSSSESISSTVVIGSTSSSSATDVVSAVLSTSTDPVLSSTASASLPVATVNFNFVSDQGFDYPMIAVTGFTGTDDAQVSYNGLTWSNEEVFMASSASNKVFVITDNVITDSTGAILAFDAAEADIAGTRFILVSPAQVGSLQTQAFAYDPISGVIASAEYMLYLDNAAILKVVRKSSTASDSYVPFTKLQALVAPVPGMTTTSTSETSTVAAPATSSTEAPVSSEATATTSESSTPITTSETTSVPVTVTSESVVMTSTPEVVTTSDVTSSTVGEVTSPSVPVITEPVPSSTVSTEVTLDLTTSTSGPVSLTTASVSEALSSSAEIVSATLNAPTESTSSTATVPTTVAVLPTVTVEISSDPASASQPTETLSAPVTSGRPTFVESSSAVETTSLEAPLSSTEVVPTVPTTESAAVGQTTIVETSTASPTTSTVAIPSAGTYVLRANGQPLVCVGPVIVAVNDANVDPSPITIDTDGTFTCNGRTGFLRPQASPSIDYDVLLLTPPPTDPAVVPGFFGFVDNVLVASLQRFQRRKRAPAVLLTIGVGANGQVIAGPNVPAGGLTVTVLAVAPAASSAAPSSGSAPASSSTLANSVLPLPGTPASNSGSSSTLVASVLPGSTTTQTVVVTTTIAGVAQTAVAVQVIVNTAGAGQSTVYVTIGGVLVQISGAGLPSIQAGVVVAGALTAAPVIVNVIVIVAPVVIAANGASPVTSLTTVTGFATVSASGLPAGAGGITIVNTAAAAITATLSVPISVATGVAGHSVVQGSSGAAGQPTVQGAPVIAGQPIAQGVPGIAAQPVVQGVSGVATAVTAVPVASNAAPASVASAVASAVAAAAAGVPKASANAAASVVGYGMSTLALLCAVLLF